MAGGFQRLMAQSFKYLPDGLTGRLGGDPVMMDGRTLDPTFQIFWKQGQDAAAGAEAPTVGAMRAGIEMGAELLANAPRPMAKIEDRTIEQDGCTVPMRIFTPRGIEPGAPVLLWFHQGGFVIGGIDCTQGAATLMAQDIGCVVISAGYRLAPEHKFPAALDDGDAVFKWLALHGAEVGIDPDKIMVGGESAGGFLAAHVSQSANVDKSGTGKKPICQLLVYPWLIANGETKSYETFADAYPLGSGLMEWFGALCFEDEAASHSPLANPGKTENLAGLPHAFIHPAGFDPLTDEAEDYAKRLEAAGVPVTFKRFDGLAHAFMGMAGALPAARAAIDDITSELRAFLANL
jgi:acetyl esterase